MFPLTQEQLAEAAARLGIVDLQSATIRQMCALAAELEKVAGEKMVHLEIGNPGFAAESVGVNAEVAALQTGIANQYPNIAGIPQLKNAASRFIKAFVDIDIQPRNIVPTVGSMQGSFTLMILLGQRVPGKNKILLINPGFPAQRHQAKLLGLETAAFDIYSYRGKALEAKLEEMLAPGDVTALIYSNPNNPAWTNLTEEELEIIGRMCTKHDVIALEDLAYFGMDFRQDVSVPGEPPFVPSVAKYTDNYILLLSGSKIFSYAGQRIAVVCMSDAVYERVYPVCRDFYELPNFGECYIYGVLYCASSGTTHSAQYALATMMDEAVNGNLPFVDHCRIYGEKGMRAKKAFTDNGFHIVYDMDGDQPVADGFFFTVGYEGLEPAEFHSELMRYGVASIPLSSTGSTRNGIRACVSMIDGEECFERLGRFLKKFDEDHSKK